MSKSWLSPKYSLIPACDLAFADFVKLVEATHSLPGISAYKVGFRLGLEVGLKQVVAAVRQFSQKPVIYDHQKAASDIPDTADLFMQVCAEAGIDCVILFPTTGPVVLKQWVEAAQRFKLRPMVGGLMTHPSYLVSEGGFIHDDAASLIYMQAAELGVVDFVLPATKPDFAWSMHAALASRGYQPSFYSPGIGTQGGSWQTLQRPDGPPWHAIAGRSLLAGGHYLENAKKLLAS